MTRDLYGDARLYEQVFPLDEEEVAFWRALAGKRPGLLLDVGAGPSGVGELIGGGRAAALDVDARLLAASPVGWRIRGDAGAMPLRGGCAGAVMSRLFGIAYAVGVDPVRRVPALAGEIGRVLAPGGVAALEIPLAVRPAGLQGLEESAEIAPGVIYRFRYFDLERRHELGAVLNTEITVEGAGERWELDAPLFVFTPEGALQWGREAGLEELRFYACYDLATGTTEPPEDALRGVLCGVRGAGARL